MKVRSLFQNRENCKNCISYEGSSLSLHAAKTKGTLKIMYTRDNNNLVFKCIAADMHTFSFLLPFKTM